MRIKNAVQARGVSWEPDTDPDPSYLEQDGFQERLAEYRAGGFAFEGCYAWAEVIINGTVQRFRSGGLWGIEDDSDAAYKADVEAEQVAELDGILRELGAA